MASQAAYGDSFLVNTPTLDRLAQQMYAEQRQRQALQQRNAQIADQQLQKEIGKIRSVDTPEVIGAYDQYKKLSQQALLDKSLANDTQKRNQVLQAAQLAKADFMQKAQQSQELLAQGKQLNMEHMKNPNQFADNFGDLMAAYTQTPMSQLSKHKLGDLTNLDTYAYKGTNTDFGKLLKDAGGILSPTGYEEKAALDKNGLQTQTTPYQFGNNPIKFRDQLVGNLAQKQAGRDAAIMWHQTPTQEKDAVDQAYAATSPDKLKKLGLTSLPDLPTNTGNDAIDWANFQAKKYLLANEPKPGKPTIRTDEAKKFSMETDRQMRMKAIEHANAKDLIQYRKSIDPNDKELTDLWVDKVIENINKDADAQTSPKGTYYDPKTQKKIYETDVPLDPILTESLKKGGISPISLRKMSDGRFRVIYPIIKDGHPVKVSTGGGAGGYAVDETLTVPITEQQLGLALGKRNVTGKQRGKEIVNILNKTPGKATAKPKNDPLGLF